MTVGVHPAARRRPFDDHPGFEGVGQEPGRDRTSLEPPAEPGHQLAEPLREREPGALAGEGPHPFTGHPAVGRDVEDPVERVDHSELDGRGEIVEVEELRRRIGLGESSPEPGDERGREA